MGGHPDFSDVAGAILPGADSELRKLVLKQLLDSTKVAAEIAPAAWAVTLFSDGCRLNVGPVEVFVLSGEQVLMNLLARADDPTLLGLPVNQSAYKSMPAPQASFYGSVLDFKDAIQRLRPFHEAFVRRAAVTAAGKPVKGTRFAHSHSQRLMDFAAKVTGENGLAPVSARAAYPFKIGDTYHRKDVFKIVGLTAEPTGGNWFTGYTAHGDDWFIFCGVGTGGRTGHDYGNHFDGDRLVWFAKTNTNIHQASIQKLINPDGNVYIFFREEDRDPFTFAGLGKAVQVADQTPVKVIWSFHAGDDTRLPTQTPEEVDEDEVGSVPEGARRTVQVNVYERDPNARRKCIAKWGVKCSVCSFDFGERYGELGEGFIHVHHLKPLGEIGEQYELNPVTDLRPVCPNCHAMLHRKKPALSIEQLVETMKKQ
ncbi:HNH endonuclease [Hydrogenophaga aquatica]